MAKLQDLNTLQILACMVRASSYNCIIHLFILYLK